MASDKLISELDSDTPDATDYFPFVKRSDTSMAASGTDKKCEPTDILDTLSDLGALTGTGGGNLSATPAAWSGNVYDFDADDVAGADGAVISSWSPRQDTLSTGALTQATVGRRPTLKTGSNGINGHNVLRFGSGGQRLVSGSIGSHFAGDSYTVIVLKQSGTVTETSFCQHGEDAGGKSRDLISVDAGGGLFSVGYTSGGGESTFSLKQHTFSTGQVLIIAVAQHSGRVLVWVNGLLVIARAAKTDQYTTYTAGTVTVGTISGTDIFEDVTRYTLADTIPPPAQAAAYLAYLADRYNVTLLGDGLGQFGGAGQVDEDRAVSRYGALTTLGLTVIGGSVPANTGGSTGATFNKPATLTVFGPVCVVMEQQEALIRNAAGGFNTLGIWNESVDGFSAVRFLRTSGEEMGALGHGGGNTGSTYAGRTFLEFSDFHNASTYGEFALVQTRPGTAKVRMLIDSAAQSISFYDMSGNVVCSVTADGQFVLPYLASDPSSPVNGSVWVRSDTNTLKYRTGAGTKTLTGS